MSTRLPARRLHRRALLGLVSGAAAVAALLGIIVSTVVTDAAFTDRAQVHLGGGAGQPLGVAQTFDIAMIGRDGRMAQGTPTAPASLAIDPAVAASLAPGRTIETTVTAFNNTPRWRAGVALAVSSPATSPMLGHLRFTAIDTATGAVLFGDATDPRNGATLDAATGALERTLAGSGRVPLAPGQAVDAVSAEARAEVRLLVAYRDDLTAAERVALNGSTVPLTVAFTAEKV